MFVKLRIAEKIITETVEKPIERFSASSDERRLNTAHILSVWSEIYPNNYDSGDDHSALLVEDVRGNIYIAKEQDDCLIGDNQVSHFISEMNQN